VIACFVVFAKKFKGAGSEENSSWWEWGARTKSRGHICKERE